MSRAWDCLGQQCVSTFPCLLFCTFVGRSGSVWQRSTSMAGTLIIAWRAKVWSSLVVSMRLWFMQGVEGLFVTALGAYWASSCGLFKPERDGLQ